MANWYGTSRSNWFQVKDDDKFIEAMARTCVDVEKRKLGVESHEYMVHATSNEGYWPPELNDEKSDEPFWFAEFLQPHLADGQVCVMQSAGAKKLHYVTGDAQAFINTGEIINMSLDDIYPKALEKFGIEPDTATY